MKLQTPKGFRDYLPADALRRKAVVAKIVKVFEKFGFDPLETPTLEYEETLMGKYGDEEKLIYKFETPGGDKVALKYDQTVPLARVIAQYGPNGQQVLPIPFKRYQIQSAYRGENTQKGRYREFLQCDADIIGVTSSMADAEILALCYEIYQTLGLPVAIKVCDRTLFWDVESRLLAAVDKLNKIGEEAVLAELQRKGQDKGEANELLKRFEAFEPTPKLKEIMNLFSQMGYEKENLVFDPTLVRGLDYYTGLIFEVVLKSDPNSSSLCGGGRWDKMIGKFTGNDLPAVGFAIGLDRTIEAMQENGLFEEQTSGAQVLVTIFSKDLTGKSIEVTNKLRAANIQTELYLDSSAKLDKQLKYADQKGIPYVIVIGPEENDKNEVTLKDLKSRTQERFTLDGAIQKLSL